ncbi:MAG: hypothetical protein GC160_22880 [Acidobacteria bacterium]|nr:hypothetical protein [Acidobacteriota bacterium]
MNNLAKSLLIAALCSLPLLAAPSENAVRVYAPFAFVAGNVHMPAGSYEISADQMTGVVTLRNLDNEQQRAVAALPIDAYNRSVKPHVEFRKMGAVMSLDKVWMSDAAVELPAPGHESAPTGVTLSDD